MLWESSSSVRCAIQIRVRKCVRLTRFFSPRERKMPPGVRVRSPNPTNKPPQFFEGARSGKTYFLRELTVSHAQAWCTFAARPSHPMAAFVCGVVDMRPVVLLTRLTFVFK